ncbi:hypothetical protein [Enterobacter sp. R1(2018)]|uniref:hypothetical protein n=1 Tax=Enterobacter sp. R1(2018) TaxID=2447891 RepID=UPI0011C46A31|nr:hypothetical protein [Enterobacter sp. R1(2018)]
MKIDGSNFTWIASTQTSANSETQRKPLGIERVSGHICPQSGYWRMEGSSASAIINVKKGTVLPFHQGKPVNWQLKEYDLSKRIDN